MRYFLLFSIIILSIHCKAQFLTGVVIDPVHNKTQLFWFKKQPYGIMALSQSIGGDFSMTNIFFNEKKYGLAIGLKTDTSASIGIVKNLYVNKNIFQPQVSYSTKHVLNIVLRSDLPINDRWVFINFTGYNKGFYSKIGLLYKFE